MPPSKREEIINLIAHELKTPTVPIIGYCEMLLNPKFGPLNPNQTEAVNEIMNNINQMQKFINEIISQQKEKELDDSLQILPKELKTPLVPILGYCEMLLNPKFGQLSSDQIEAINEIQQNSIQLNYLINSFWDAQQLELGKMKYFYETVDVGDFIEQIMKTSSDLMIEKKIEFRKSIESRFTIKADRTKLEEIFRNLISNAVKFVPETDGKIQISVKSQDSFVRFSVENNGDGIPKEKINSLFKKFHQIDTSHRRIHSGGGLGLTICKGYIEGMKGKIWVESEEGKDTTFFFTIPKISKNH
jgi:signal transduction histidine kinase